jgi:signal transduction histidine kinase
MSDEAPASALSLGARVAAIQVAVSALCWMGVGLFNAKGTWLLEPSQEKLAATLLLHQLPVVGVIGAVLIPVLLSLRLVHEASGPGLLDADYLKRVLGFPQDGALAGLVTSVVVFLFAGWELRRSCAIPPIESAKIGALGILTGTLLSVLSYFCLQAAVQPLIRHAIDRGAMAPQRPTFPIRKKILAVCIAVALIVAGLFGMDALTWSQRYTEEKTATEAVRLAGDMARSIRENPPQGREGWRSFFGGRIKPEGAVLYAQGAGGNILATEPRDVSGIEAYLLRSDFFTSGSKAPVDGSFVSRWGDVRIVARAPSGVNGSVGIILRTDPSVLRRVIGSLLLVTVEAGLAALLLAWISGAGMTGPLRRLALNAEAFASAETNTFDAVPVVTDDEISNLAAAFDRMAVARREAQKQLQDAGRRAERDEVLARVAHEVRNPIFGITSTVAALETEIGDGRHAEYFTVLRAECQRISSLVDEMLSPRLRLGPGSVTDLKSVTAEAESVLRSRFPERDFLLTNSGGPAAPCPLDRAKATSLMTHLLESAVLRLEGRSEVRLRFERKGQETIVEMQDRGIPVRAEDLRLQPGEEGGPTEWKSSFLACRTIVEGAGGEILLRSSSAADGTVFEIRMFESTGMCNS